MKSTVMSIMIAVGLLLVSTLAHAEEPTTPPAPAAEPERASSPVDDAPPTQPRTHVGPRLEGGYALRRLFNLTFNGVDAAAGVQIEPDRLVGVFVRVRYGRGATHDALHMDVVRVEGGVEARPLERLRLGGSVGVSYVSVARATHGDSLTKLGLGVSVLASVDIIHGANAGLYVGGQGGAEAYPHFEKSWGLAGVLYSGGPIVGVRF